MVAPATPVGLGRQVPGETPAAERVRTYDEVSLGLAPAAALGEASRCLRCDVGRAEREGDRGVAEKVKVRIDGEVIAATTGQTILEVARANGTAIPALCHMDGLTPVGACRLCVVEVSGLGRLLPACTTPVAEGLAVTTSSPKLQAYRKIALELLLVERNHICAVCVSSGHCELQTLAEEHGVTHVRYPYDHPRFTPDTSHPRFVLDDDRCILCSRCVRTCAEIEGAHVWDLAGRGIGHAARLRAAPPLGRGHDLHELRQVRAGLPDGCAGREGTGRRGDAQAGLRRGRPELDARGPLMGRECR